MRLSEKGYLKIGNSIVGWLENGVAKVTFDPDKIEFDQADFKDCVMLTVDEAKAVLECVDACASPSPFEDFVSKTILLRDELKKRIEQVEEK